MPHRESPLADEARRQARKHANQVVGAARAVNQRAKRESLRQADFEDIPEVHPDSSATQSAPASIASAAAEAGGVNVTLAYLPTQQTLCGNRSEVINGAVLNVTWISGGIYSSTLYARYAGDGYNAWTTIGPSFAPVPDLKVPASLDSDPLYRYTFQTSVWQYQRGIMFTVLQYSQSQNKTLPALHSKPLSIVNGCSLKTPPSAVSTLTVTALAQSPQSTKRTSKQSQSFTKSQSQGGNAEKTLA